MYLSHHYAVDLVGGSIISAGFFYVAKTNWLPRRQADKSWRWDYDYIEIGDVKVGADEWEYEYGLRDVAGWRRRGSEEWTLGDSSSSDSGSERGKEGIGGRERDSWEGETLRGRESGSELEDGLPR